MTADPSDADREMNRRGLLGSGQRTFLEAFAPTSGFLRFFAGGGHLRGDLNRGAVQAVAGEIVYGPRRLASMYGAWFARTVDGRERDLWMPRTPLPGGHVFYVLPESGVVVGTEPETLAHVAQYDAALRSFQGLTPADVDAVHANAIPPGLARLARRPPNLADVGIATFAFVLGLVLAAFVPFMIVAAPHPQLAGMAVLSTVFCSLGWYWGVRQWARVRSAARAGRTRTVEGPVHKDYIGSKSSGLVLKVAGIEVDVTNRRPLYDFVCEGVAHRLYLTDADVLVAILARPLTSEP